MKSFRVNFNNSKLQQLGASYQTVYLLGAASLKTYAEPNNFELLLAQELQNAGWGIIDLEVTNAIDIADKTQWLRVLSIPASLLPTWNYFIKVTINAQQNDNPERIKQGIAAVFSKYFNNIRFNYSTENSSPNSAVNLANSVTDSVKNVFNGLPAVSSSITSVLIVGGILYLILSRD